MPQELDPLILRLVGDAQDALAEIQKLRAEVDDFVKDMESELGQAEDAVSEVMTSSTNMGAAVGGAMQQVGGAVQQVGQQLQSFGRNWSLYITAPLLALGALAVHEFASFDDAMTKSTAIMSGVTAELRAGLEQGAFEISRNSVTTATEAAEAYYFLASAGLSAEQSLGALPVVEKFAVAGAFDMARATDLVTDAQSALGLTVADTAQNIANMTRVSDVMVKAATLANTSVEQLGDALTNKVGGSLRLLGKDVEEGAAVLAAYADQGTKGRAAGEKLDIVLRELQRAAREQAGAWDEMGLAVYDANGRMRPLADIISDLEDNLGGMSAEQRGATMAVLGFTAESGSAIGALLGMSDRIRGYEEALRSAAGTTQEVADKQLASFSSQMKILRNQLDEVVIEIGAALVPMLQSAIDIVKSGIQWWRDQSDETKQWLVVLGGLVAAMGPVIVVIGGVVAAIGAMISGIGGLVLLGPEVLAVIVGIAGALIMSIPAFIAIGVAVWELVNWLLGPGGLQEAWTTSTTAVGDFVGKAWGFLLNFRANLGILINWIATQWHVMLADLLGIIVNTIKSMIMNFGVAVRTILRLWMALNGWVGQQFKNLFTVEFVNWVIQGLIVAARKFQEFAAAAWEHIKAIFTGRSVDMSAFIEQLGKDFAKGAKNSNFLATAKEIIQEEMGNLSGPTTGLTLQTEGPQFLYDTAKQAGDDIKAGLAEGVAGAADSVQAEAEQVAASVDELGKAVADLETQLEEQVATYSMSANEIKLWKLEQMGATEAQLANARALEDKLGAMEREARLMREGEALTRELLDPMEKYQAELAHLDELLGAGAITYSTYLDAQAALMDEFFKLDGAEAEIKFTVKGIDAVEAGTAEAAARLAEFRALQPEAVALGGGPAAVAGDVATAVADNLTLPTGGISGGADDYFTREATKMEELLGRIVDNTDPDKNTLTVEAEDAAL